MPPIWHWAFRMPDGGDSFLPRIQSVFYAVFDVKHGPKIVYQVPEGLIASSGTISVSNNNSPSVPPTPSLEVPSPLFHSPAATNSNSSSGLSPSSRTSSTSRISPIDPKNISSPQIQSNSAQRALFNFDDIHKYVIPPSALCGRLVICSTKNHRIIGFPVALKGRQYERNFFRYNICFVFDRGADLSCYDPIVRKVSRVLTACEEESRFLSLPSKSHSIHAILEQLYEDLNSYAETSIPIDQFNSIELKIFPFYPNPPPVQDWMVPLALINLAKRVEDNWDLTLANICKYIDGTNHVSRIAYLADCDITLTRQALSHLLYYQVIMTIDIFQYSNMYTLRKSIQWLADEIHVKEECGPYVTRPGYPVPDWPRLLHLYSRLKPGKTVYEWCKEYEIEKLGIDVRRFTSFGVIKGFLRRIHRWPVYLPSQESAATNAPTGTNTPFDIAGTRKRGHSLSGVPLRFPFTPQTQLGPGDSSQHIYRTTRPQTAGAQPGFPNPEHSQHGITAGGTPITVQQYLSPVPTSTMTSTTSTHRARRASAAEKILEHLRNRDKSAAAAAAAAAAASGGRASPRNSWIPFQLDSQHHSHSNEPSSSLTPPTYSNPQVQTNGGTPNMSRSVTPTHTTSNFPTPTQTVKSLHGYGHNSGSGPSIVPVGIGPGATLVSGLPPLSQPQEMTFRGPAATTAITTATAVFATSTQISHTHTSSGSGGSGGIKRSDRRQSLTSGAPPALPVVPKATLATPSRPRISRSPSASQLGQSQMLGHGFSSSGNGSIGTQGKTGPGGGLEYPPQLIPLLDGEHHTDELCTKFEVGWPLLERWLELIGGGEVGSEEGKVVIIYR